MDFEKFNNLLYKLSKTSKRTEKILILRDFILENREEDIGFILDLIIGNFFRELGKKNYNTSIKTALDVISETYNKPSNLIIKEFNKIGDVGKVAGNNFRKINLINSYNLTVEILKETLTRISKVSGANSNKVKKELLMKLLAGAKTPLEALFLSRIFVNDLRIGVAEGVIKETLANVFFKSVKLINLKCQSCGYINLLNNTCFKCKSKLNKKQDFVVGTKCDYKENLNCLLGNFEEYIEANNQIEAREIYNKKLQIIEERYNLLNNFSIIWDEVKNDSKKIFEARIILGRPIKSMLGLRVINLEKSVKDLGLPLLTDFKYDGLRMQIHKLENDVKIFSRNLEELTDKFPEVVEFFLKNYKNETFIIDSEGVGYDYKNKVYLPFQKFSKRFQAKNIEDVKDIKLTIRAFDIMFYNGKNLIKRPYEERRKILENLFIKREISQLKYFDTKDIEKVKKD